MTSTRRGGRERALKPAPGLRHHGGRSTRRTTRLYHQCLVGAAQASKDLLIVTHASRARQRVLKRLQRHARRLEESGRHAAAALVDYRIGRLRGMGLQLDVEVNVRGRVVHQHLPADPTAWLQAVLAGFAELGLLPGGSPADLPAQVVRVEANGHTGDGRSA